MQRQLSGTTPADPLTTDRDFRSHIEFLGLSSVEVYQEWCAEHGFGVRIKKNWKQRCRERFFAAQHTIRDRCVRARSEARRPRSTLQRLLAGEISEAELTQPHLVLIHRTASSAPDEETLSAFRQLLGVADGGTKLLTNRSAVPRFENRSGNSYIEGLMAVARQHRHWIRRPRSWICRSHSVRRQFGSLISHLLVTYPVPQFMESVWFKGSTVEANRQQRWFQAIASGVSPRQLDLPLKLTKRMAHYFLKAPRDFSVESALRFGQIVGLGGNIRLVRALLDSRIGTSFENDEFWTTVIRWLVQNPMFDPAQVGPLIDYVARLKFEPQPIVVGPGEVELRPIAPDFSITDRTATSLMRQMHEWHADLRKGTPKPELEWTPSGVESFELIEGTSGSGDRRHWSIVELCSRKQLHHEGQVMRHCVASYEGSCASGGTSIWSLGVVGSSERRRSVLTIEVTLRKRQICQVRGKTNRLPTHKEMDVVRSWANQAGLVLSDALTALCRG